jgi:hypothetical protein
MTRPLVVLALLAVLPGGAAAQVLTLADAQVIDLAERGVVLRLRSSDAQAFDVVAQRRPDRVVVKLHRARLGELAPLAPAAFGAVRLRQERGHVQVRLELAPGWSARVVQGATPNVVDVRLAR